MGRPNDLLGSPFRLVVCGAATWASPKKAKKCEPPYTCFFGSPDYVLSPTNVDSFEGLVPFGPIDPGAMRNSLTTGEGTTQGCFAIKTRCHQPDTFHAQNFLCQWPMVDASCN
jgi:hypothetical protein